MRRVQGRKTRGRVGRRYGHGRRQRQRTAGVGVDVGRTARPGKSRIRRQRLSRSMHPDPLTIRTVHKTLGVSLLPLPQYPLLPMDTLGCHSYRSVAISNASTSSSARASFPRAYLHRWAAAQDSRNSSFCLTTASPSSLCQFHASITSTAPAARSHVSPEHVSLEPAEHEPRSHHT